jgi:hypothetical protein
MDYLDLLLLKRCVFGTATAPNSDLNGDGSTNTLDVIVLKNALVNR